NGYRVDFGMHNAIFMSALALIAIMLMVHTHPYLKEHFGKKVYLLTIPTIIFLVFCLVISQTRQTMLAAALASCVLVLVLAKNKANRLKLIGALVLLALLF